MLTKSTLSVAAVHNVHAVPNVLGKLCELYTGTTSEYSAFDGVNGFCIVCNSKFLIALHVQMWSHHLDNWVIHSGLASSTGHFRSHGAWTGKVQEDAVQGSQ